MPGYKTYSRRRKTYTFVVDGAISAANDLDHDMVLGAQERLVGVVAACTNSGTTSGAISVMVHRTRAGTDADLLSAAFDIDYDSTTKYAEAAKSTFQNGDLQKGDILTLDVNAVPGAGSPVDLVVKVITHIEADEA